jgi:hypothetical protein
MNRLGHNFVALLASSAMTLRVGLFVISCIVASSLTTAQTLTLQPTEIQAGQKAKLRWDVGKAVVFILGYGKLVSGHGEVDVEALSSTDFVMVAQTPQGVQYTSRRLIVNGAKGDDDYPSLKDFDDPVSESVGGTSYPNFQNTVWSCLEDHGYSVRGDFSPKRSYVTIYTDFVLRRDLLGAEKIRARRLAIAVDIYEPKGGRTNFGVRPKLEFQYRGENEWRPDKESKALAKDEARKFAELLKGVG